MALPSSGLSDHAATGGAHHLIEIRPLLGLGQCHEYAIQCRQISGVNRLFRRPSVYSAQDRPPRFMHERPRG